MCETRKQRIKGNTTKGFETYMCTRTENLSENRRANKKKGREKEGTQKGNWRGSQKEQKEFLVIFSFTILHSK